MLSFVEQARWYTKYHQNEITRYIHMMSIPIILLSFLILLGFIHILIPGVLEITLADIAAVILLIYYFRLNWRLALIFVPILIILLWIANLFSYTGPNAFSLWSFVIILLLGCVLQLIGYIIEGSYPAFSTNLWQVLAAPMFLLAEIFFIAGRMRALKEEIYGPEGKTDIELETHED